jgi:hypothetical protein
MTVCEFPECKKNAYFNTEGTKIGRFCSAHKENGMINVKDKRCLTEGCSQRPSFNILGGKPLYCGSHRLENMVNVMTKFCEHEGCLITPVYNTPDKKSGRFCATHKEPNMINVVNNLCNNEECNNAPSYGMVGERPTYCALHKLEGMVDVKHKRCVYDGCDKTPSYANPDQKIPTHCLTHKTEIMVNVKHKKCQSEGCGLIPSYNLPNEKTAKFCKNHKLDGMIDVTHQKCLENDCNNRAVYNLANETIPRFCILHKTDQMIGLTGKKCVSEWCVNRCSANTIYESYCLHCFIHLFPEKPTTRNYKTKEQSVVEHVKANFPDFTWVCDRRIADGCSRRRSDLLLDLGFQVIIVEVDENQHVSYDCSCENRRLMELSQDVGHRPIVFIRFNPDDYNKTDGTRVRSCWSFNKSIGSVFVDKNNRRQWNDRLATLTEWITYWSANKTNKVVEVVQLFFDE